MQVPGTWLHAGSWLCPRHCHVKTLSFGSYFDRCCPCWTTDQLRAWIILESSAAQFFLQKRFVKVRKIIKFPSDLAAAYHERDLAQREELWTYWLPLMATIDPLHVYIFFEDSDAPNTKSGTAFACEEVSVLLQTSHLHACTWLCQFCPTGTAVNRLFHVATIDHIRV